MTKKNKIYLILTCLIIVTFTLLDPIMYANKTITCAQFKSFSKVRGSKKLIYQFKLLNVLYEGKMDVTLHTSEEINELKKSNCIKIEVSNYWSFFNRVIEEN